MQTLSCFFALSTTDEASHSWGEMFGDQKRQLGWCVGNYRRRMTRPGSLKDNSTIAIDHCNWLTSYSLFFFLFSVGQQKSACMKNADNYHGLSKGKKCHAPWPPLRSILLGLVPGQSTPGHGWRLFNEFDKLLVQVFQRIVISWPN